MDECYRTTIAGFDIALMQDSRGSFRVDYGLQHGTFTTYDRAAHDKAFDSRDYAPLVRSTPLEISADGTVALPALAPWGVVIVTR